MAARRSKGIATWTRAQPGACVRGGQAALPCVQRALCRLKARCGCGCAHRVDFLVGPGDEAAVGALRQHARPHLWRAKGVRAADPGLARGCVAPARQATRGRRQARRSPFPAPRRGARLVPTCFCMSTTWGASSCTWNGSRSSPANESRGDSVPLARMMLHAWRGAAGVGDAGAGAPCARLLCEGWLLQLDTRWAAAPWPCSAARPLSSPAPCC